MLAGQANVNIFIMFNKDDLLTITKPSRYLGGEINSIKKDLSQVRLKFCLAFPDVYEVGMSHLGLQILYYILNKQPDIACERVFAPWPDMENFLRARQIPLTTLESSRPLQEFDLIGFSLQYELNYTGVLNILDLAGIPFQARERGEEYPLIIGGGPITANPEPLADFFDFFVLGDGEEVILEVCREVIAYKNKKETKLELYRRLARIEGIYIPSFFKVTYYPDGRLEQVAPLQEGYYQAKRRVLADLDQGEFPDQPLLPFTEIIHDRLNIEIARGCTRGCRFCQAGMIYRPLRERSPQNILQLVEAGLKSTGHDEVSLLSLSTGDYSQIDKVLPRIINLYQDKKIAVSLPSLRVETLTPLLIEKIRQIRKTGFTLAPEAGTDRLRRFINKNNTEEDLLSTIRTVFAANWRLVKLYFMIGLPTETEEDLEGIVSLCQRALKEARQVKSSAQINVSISTFIPKPHTPLQWESQSSLAEIYAKQKFLKQRLPKRGINLKWTDPQMSLLEGVFARGDRRLSKVLERAYNLGCRLDGWGDHFRYDLWLKAFAQVGLDPAFYTYRPRDLEELMPWDHLDMRLSKDFLREERKKAWQLLPTPDCRHNSCPGCGVCWGTDQLGNRLAPEIGLSSAADYLTPPERKQPSSIYRYRMQYSKLGMAKFLSHLELSRLILRAFRRANIPLLFSQGFHPAPRISFGPPLPVGYESIAEFLDFLTAAKFRPAEILTRLNQVLPAGIQILKIDEISLKSPSIFDNILYVTYEINLAPGQEWPKEEVRQLLNGEKIFFWPRKNKSFPLKNLLKAIELISDHTLSLVVQGEEGKFIRPEEILSFIFNWEDSQRPIIEIKKTQVEFKE
ncbi:MAG: TIGR03960 family B12-binding radical SAM protein [Thermodesulfobacteriota bacterium]